MRVEFRASDAANSASVKRPSGSECGTATLLVGIEAGPPGYELHTFQCRSCEHFETAVGLSAAAYNGVKRKK